MAGLRADLLVPYQLRTVRVGVTTTALVFLVLAIYLALPERPTLDVRLYLGLMVVATAGLLIVHWLPWRRLFDAGYGQWALYLWSAVDIVLIAALVAVNGGLASSLWIIYGATIIFAAASYPLRGQAGLLVATVLSYLGAIWLAGDPFPPAELFARLSGLGIVAFIGAFLSMELARQMTQHASARTESDRRARLFAAVAAASRSMQAPRPDLVSATLADAVLELGFEAAVVATGDAGRRRVECVSGGRALAARLVRYVRATPEPAERVTLDLDNDTTAEFARVLVLPITVDGETHALLLAARRGLAHPRSEEREAVELLCSVAGRAIESSAYASRLRANQERFRALVQHSSDLTVVVDEQWRITEWSESIERLIGVAAHRVIGRPFEEVMRDSEAEPLFEAMRDVVGYGGSSRPVSVHLPDRDGEPRSVEVVATNLLAHPDVQGIVLNGRDVTERQALAAELEWRRYRSALTGLPNRAGLIRHTIAWLGERRPEESTAVLFINLENFTGINDLYGRQTGDDLLRAVAERFAHALPLGLELAHLGGDQFAVLAPGHDAPAAQALAAELLGSLDQPFDVADADATLAAAVGIGHDCSGRLSAEALLEQAEVAAYIARSSEVTRVALYSEQLQSERLAQIRLEHDLRRAIAHEELSLVYQPIVDLASGQVTAMEALLRWRHPERGAIPPRAFIPLAESTGLIVPLGAWVARAVCEQLAAWRDPASGVAGVGVSVNVSPLQLTDGRFAHELATWIADLDLDPAQITLELTEETFAAEASEVSETVASLRALGVRLAVDDFGSGYSSFGYLQRFPVDCVKIDQSFVRSIGTQGDDLLLDAIVDMAHRLGLPVIAEGVEDPRQVEYLRRIGCEYVQGFLLSEPVALPEVTEARDQAQTRAARLVA